jgi:hypothetical protein
MEEKGMRLFDNIVMRRITAPKTDGTERQFI